GEREMSYHRATLRLLDLGSETSSEAESTIRQAENRLGVVFPTSVRQWYIRPDAIKILEQNSNGRPPIPISEFAVIDCFSYRLLPFRNENQGVCTGGSFSTVRKTRRFISMWIRTANDGSRLLRRFRSTSTRVFGIIS